MCSKKIKQLRTDSACRFAQNFEWKEEYFCQLLNVQNVNDVRHTETVTAESLAAEPSACENEIATKDFNPYPANVENMVSS